MLESGVVSLKNEVNIMMKNVVDVVLGGITYWAFGYGLSYGEDYSNDFFSLGNWFVGTSHTDRHENFHISDFRIGGSGFGTGLRFFHKLHFWKARISSI